MMTATRTIDRTARPSARERTPLAARTVVASALVTAIAVVGAPAAALADERGGPQHAASAVRTVQVAAATVPSATTDPVTLTVTSGADSGPGSLRAATTAAAALPGPVLVVVDPAVGTVTLDSTVELAGDLTLVGQGQDATTVTGSAAFPHREPLLSAPAPAPAAGPSTALSLRALTLARAGAGDQLSARDDLSGTGTLSVALSDVALAGGDGLALNLAGGAVALDRVTTRETARIAVEGAGSVVVRDSRLDVPSLEVLRTDADVRVTRVSVDMSRRTGAAASRTYRVEGVGGDVVVEDSHVTGGGRDEIGQVRGDLVLRDTVWEVGTGREDLVADGVHVSGLGGDLDVQRCTFTDQVDGLHVDGAAAGAATIAGTDLGAPVGEGAGTGLRLSGFTGQVEVTDTRVAGFGRGVRLDDIGTALLADLDVTVPTSSVSTSYIGIMTGATTTAVRDTVITGYGIGVETLWSAGPDAVLHVERSAVEARTTALALYGPGDSRVVRSTLTGPRVIDARPQEGAVVEVVASTLRTVDEPHVAAPAVVVLGDGSLDLLEVTAVATRGEHLIELGLDADRPATDRPALRVRHSTVAGAGLATVHGSGTESVVVDASILATPPGVPDVLSSGPRVTVDRSLVTATAAELVEASAAAGGSVELGATTRHGADARLSELGDHGGPTPTMLPLPGSAALDALEPVGPGLPDTDQRGVARVRGALDVGAVEVDAGTLVLTGDQRVRGGQPAVLAVVREGTDTATHEATGVVVLEGVDAVAGVDYVAVDDTAVRLGPGTDRAELVVETLAADASSVRSLHAVLTSTGRSSSVGGSGRALVEIEQTAAAPTTPGGGTPGPAAGGSAVLATPEDAAAGTGRTGGTGSSQVLATTGTAAGVPAAAAAGLLLTGAALRRARRRAGR
jgi:hypothetical protein